MLTLSEINGRFFGISILQLNSVKGFSVEMLNASFFFQINVARHELMFTSTSKCFFFSSFFKIGR